MKVIEMGSNFQTLYRSSWISSCYCCSFFFRALRNSKKLVGSILCIVWQFSKIGRAAYCKFLKNWWGSRPTCHTGSDGPVLLCPMKCKISGNVDQKCTVIFLYGFFWQTQNYKYSITFFDKICISNYLRILLERTCILGSSQSTQFLKRRQRSVDIKVLRLKIT